MFYQTKSNRIFYFSRDFQKIYLFENSGIKEYSSSSSESKLVEIAEMSNSQIALVIKSPGNPLHLAVTCAFLKRNGKHIINVKAILPDGSCTESEAVVIIDVQRPYYLKSWFFGFLILIFGGCVYALYAWRTHILKNNE